MTSVYLDRLAHSTRFDAWRTEELTAALASLDAEIDERWSPRQGGPRVLNIRLQIYRQRLQRELDQRAADESG
ncbi:hypothetical protein [Kribbella sp. NPDC050459]|uniref:hypothetical protein n=1 Tax=Kribbella sp. NPDC050459 TaxID=3155785 RepID=UPI0033EC7A2C